MGNGHKDQFMDYMVVHRYANSTIKNYIDIMTRLVKFHNKSPDLISSEDIQKYLLYLLHKRKLSWGTCNYHLSGISCFYKNVLQRDERSFKLPPRPRTNKLPKILSTEEVKKLFEAAVNLKHRVLLKTIYSAGLRISEVVKLKPIHIESDPSRMMIRVEQGKGNKDRYTVLSKHLLGELRIYWQKYKPVKWLFPGINQEKHIGYTAARDAFYKAKKKPV